MNPTIFAGEDATGLWLRALRGLINEGERVSPRGMGTLELRPAILSLRDPRKRWVQVPERKLSKALGYIEAFLLLTGMSDAELLVKAAPQYANFVNPETKTLDGAYGPRVGPQLDYIRELLRRDPDTRQAVVTIFGPADHHESRDVPCTVSLHFMVRDGALELIVYMRSNDVWLGWPYDVVMFTVLHEALAVDLGLALGQYTHVAGSLHLYDRNSDKAVRIAAEYGGRWTESDVPMPEGATLEELQGYARALLSAYRRDLTVKDVLGSFSRLPAFFKAAAREMLEKEA